MAYEKEMYQELRAMQCSNSVHISNGMKEGQTQAVEAFSFS
jgi:hypothetical protein